MSAEGRRKMAEKKRLANYELLRTIAMVMVVVLHFLSHSDSLLSLETSVSGVRILGTLLESFCLVAVNVYILISGYFGVKSSYHPIKAVSLLCQIWFYAFFLLAAAMLLGLPTGLREMGIYGAVKYLFPIESETYWFATSYLMLYIISPVLNRGARELSQKQLQITIGGLLVLFCVIKSISPVAFPVDRYGYDLPWFICVYLIAAYLGLYGSDFWKKHGLLIYAGSSILTFGMVVALWFVARRWDSFSYYFTVPFHYNFLLCLTGAIGLFYSFSHLRIKEGKMAAAIRKLGALSFGVYLFHEHMDIRPVWYEYLKRILNPAGKEGIGVFFRELLGSVVILFAVGIFIDVIRSLLFAAVGKKLAKTAAGRKLQSFADEK